MKRKIAPIIIVVLLCIYLITYIIGLTFGIFSEAPIGVTIILGLVAIAVVGVIIALIYTLIIRLKEIDKEDKDDLSKY